MNTLALMPGLWFHVGQRVIERYGDTQETAKTCQTEVISVDGRTCRTETGAQWCRLTGAAVPKGTVYRSIRGMTPQDHRQAENLLGGVEGAKKP